MINFPLSTKSLLAAGFSLAVLSPALAMPSLVGAPSASAAPLRQVDWSQHRVYPGSESKDAQKARDERNAPNRFCEKQQQYCE